MVRPAFAAADFFVPWRSWPASGCGPATEVTMSDTYAGDISPRDAWGILVRDETAVLVDVRTEPEWRYVGLPDLSALGRATVCVSWQIYPTMEQNARFVEDVVAAGVTSGQPVLLLCRSGVRSRAAAIALTAHGLGPCYNIAGGFEGPHDEDGRRGRRTGWKVAGLPWRQD